ncbi:MAG: hypothetical protein Q8M11_02705 [Sulfuritalea sp.]|nr:hypothetical protein [Sulfuritalea sp.]MDP1984272.1 hypothetical protein [Sulfuritalea sp.]
MRKFLVVAFLGVPMVFFAEAQTINFDDLKRPGKSPEKSWTLDGVSSEARGYINQFGDADTTRVERSRASQAAASANASSANSNGPNAKKGSASAPKSPTSSSSSGNALAEVYDGGMRSAKGHRIMIIRCTRSGKHSVFVDESGVWRDSGGTSYNDKFRGKQINQGTGDEFCRDR